MKVHLGWLVAAVVLTFGITRIASRLAEPLKRSQRASLAGQTLANLSRSLESHRTSAGSYPESLGELTVENTGGDSSAEFLRHVIYRKTDHGYIAFVGISGAAYIESGQPTRYEAVR